MSIRYPIKILYVEDDKLFRDLVKSILKDKSKYVVDVAEYGMEGIRLNLKNTYDIVFLDIVMQDTSGISTAYAIKLITPSIPVVAVTALEKNDIKNFDDKHFPIDYYIKKPIYSNIFIKKMEDILENNFFL